jgi:hypothetical protein
VKTRWIVNQKFDLAFFIAPYILVFGFYWFYLFLSSYLKLNSTIAVIICLFLFEAVFDFPHQLQTFVRAYADKTEFNRHKYRHLSLPVIMIALALLVVHFNFIDAFRIFVAYYGLWHVVRQDWGFLKAYRSLNEKQMPHTLIYDRLLFFSFHIGWMLVGATSFFALDAAYYERWFGAIYAPLIGLYLLRVLIKAPTEGINWPKIILILTNFASFYFIYLVAVIPLVTRALICSPYHDIQYHAWTGRYQEVSFAGGKAYAKRVLRNCFLIGVPLGALAQLLLTFFETDTLFTFFLAILLFHYITDSYIWKQSSQPELRKILAAAK